MDNIEKIDLAKIDWKSSKEFFESLTSELEKLEDRDESYNFTWVGKRKSIIEAGRPVNKILRPDIDASKDFDNTKNMLIVGDNLDALKILQESYLGQVKMIYIDPPYNTGHDFVYHDNFSVKKDDYEDSSISENGERIVSEDEFTENSKSNGRFHSDWLSMMYPRLKLARNLLSDDGVIFISIDDNEQANLKKLCDEIFGEENFMALLIWEKTQHFGRQKLNSYSNGDYIYCYARNAYNNKLKELLVEKVQDNLQDAPLYNASNNENVLTFPAGTVKFNIGDGIYNATDNEDYVLQDSVAVKNGKNVNDFSLRFRSRWSNKTLQEEIANGTTFWVKTVSFAIRAIYGNGKTATVAPRQIIFTNKGNPACTISRFDEGISTSERATNAVRKLLDGEFFSYPKPVSLIKYLASMLYDEQKEDFSNNSLILDFFAGSGTTGHAVMDLNAEDGGNRKYILVQWPEETNEKSEARKAGYETIDQITAERLRRAGEKVLKDHPDAKIDTGFRVFRIDDSNEKENIRKPLEEYTQESMLDMVDNLKSDRTPLDLLFEAIYASALPFDLHLETRKIGDNTVYLYGYLGENSGLAACFDDAISDSTIKEIAKLKPIAAVFKDSSFADSAAKINLSEHFRILAVDTKVKVI